MTQITSDFIVNLWMKGGLDPPSRPLAIYEGIFYLTYDDKNPYIKFLLSGTNEFAVVASKCNPSFAEGIGDIWEIVDSDEDISTGKSPLRPFNCTKTTTTESAFASGQIWEIFFRIKK